MGEWGMAVLRVAIGASFLAHGLLKLSSVWTGSPVLLTVLFPTLASGLGRFLLAGVGLFELGGSLAFLAGAFTRTVALVLMIDILPVIWRLLMAQGLFLNWSGVPGAPIGAEYHLLLLAGLICTLLAGPGALSVDRNKARSAERVALGRARARSGAVN